MMAVDHDMTFVVGYFPPAALEFGKRNEEATEIGDLFFFGKAHVDEHVLLVLHAPLLKFADADFSHLLNTLDCDGTELVSQTLPPMIEAWPTTVSPPRMVEFE